MKSVIEVIKDFIKTCPYLQDFEDGIKNIGVDYLDEKPDAYVIESVPVNPIVKYYTDGSAEKQFAFVFASKEYYGRDAMTNIENIGFYEKFSSWLMHKTRMRELPDLGEGREAWSVQATLTPYLFDIDPEMDVARYQIQCVLNYYESRDLM